MLILEWKDGCEGSYGNCRVTGSYLNGKRVRCSVSLTNQIHPVGSLKTHGEEYTERLFISKNVFGFSALSDRKEGLAGSVFNAWRYSTRGDASLVGSRGMEGDRYSTITRTTHSTNASELVTFRAGRG